MSKPKVLFVTEKYCGQNPKYGLTNSFHNLFGSLESTGKAEVVNLFLEDHAKDHPGKRCGSRMVKMAEEAALVVLTITRVSPSPRFHFIGKLRCPSVSIFFDYVGPSNKAIAELMLPYITANVVLDTHKIESEMPEKFLSLWTPQDPGLFYDPDFVRDIDISFIGTVKGRKDRLEGIAALREAGINIYVDGGQRENLLSPEKYAEITQRSKIVVNWDGNRNHTQLKGRIFEATLCGAMLLESSNDEVLRYYTPYEEFIPFDTAEDLVYKVQRYLKFDDERQRVALAGYRKATENYNAENWWKVVFEKCEIDI